jgi:hypothetical protein
MNPWNQVSHMVNLHDVIILADRSSGNFEWNQFAEFCVSEYDFVHKVQLETQNYPHTFSHEKFELNADYRRLYIE